MLPKINRLPKNCFTAVYKKGKRIYRNQFTLIYLLNDGTQQPQIGIVVSNKVSKKATERNKVKRIFRNCVYPFLTTLPRHIQIVIVARKDILANSYNEICSEIEGMFKRI